MNSIIIENKVEIKVWATIDWLENMTTWCNKNQVRALLLQLI